jgi:hypothetical protein
MYQLQLPGAEVSNVPLTIAVGIAESDVSGLFLKQLISTRLNHFLVKIYMPI